MPHELPERYFQAFHHSLQFQYFTECGCSYCQSHKAELSANNTNKKSFKKVLNAGEKAFKRLFANKNYKPEDLFKMPEYKALIDETAKVFNSAIAYEVSDTMRYYLEQDVFVFSGLKTHAQLTEARSYLKDKEGNVTPYYKFEQKVLKLNKTYNQNYLQAEYEFAIHSAQSAERWENLQDNEERYLLQYRTAGDNRVRAEHQELAGITLPKSDSFWSCYTPPNGWRCRCLAVEVLAREHKKSNSKEAIKKGEAATTQIGSNGKNKLAMFRFNPGIDKKVFPPKNSYSKIVGADRVLKEAGKYHKTYNPKAIREYKNGGKIIQCDLVDTQANDYERVLKVADFWAKQGDTVEIMPKLDTYKDRLYNVLYKDLIGTKYFGKMPDLKRNGILYEHEGFRTKKHKNALSKMLSRGLKQSDKIVIDKVDCTDNYLNKLIKFRKHEGIDITELWILDGSNMYKFYP